MNTSPQSLRSAKAVADIIDQLGWCLENTVTMSHVHELAWQLVHETTKELQYEELMDSSGEGA
jgi:hypothetical protein